MEKEKNILVSILISILIVFIIIVLILALAYLNQKINTNVDSCKTDDDCKSGFVCKKQNVCEQNNQQKCLIISYCEENKTYNKNTDSICGNNICEDKEDYKTCKEDCINTGHGVFCEVLKKDIIDELELLQECSSNDDCIKEINPIPCELSVCGVPYNKNLNLTYLNEISKKYKDTCPITECPKTGCLEGYKTLCIENKCKKIMTK